MQEESLKLQFSATRSHKISTHQPHQINYAKTDLRHQYTAFLSSKRRRLSRETSPAARSEERRHHKQCNIKLKLHIFYD